MEVQAQEPPGYNAEDDSANRLDEPSLAHELGALVPQQSHVTVAQLQMPEPDHRYN